MSFDPNDMGPQVRLPFHSNFHIPYGIRMDQSFPCRDVNQLDLKADYCHTHPQTGHHVAVHEELFSTYSSERAAQIQLALQFPLRKLDAFNYGSSLNPCKSYFSGLSIPSGNLLHSY